MWVRDARALPTALSITPEYLRNPATESGEVIDYRDWQVPRSRRMRALKIWSGVHGAGLEGLRESIRGHVAMADSLAGRIESEPGCALAAPPSLALVCLYVVNRDGRPDDAATKAANGCGQRRRAFLPHAHIGRRSLRDPRRNRYADDAARPHQHPLGLASQGRSPERLGDVRAPPGPGPCGKASPHPRLALPHAALFGDGNGPLPSQSPAPPPEPANRPSPHRRGQFPPRPYTRRDDPSAADREMTSVGRQATEVGGSSKPVFRRVVHRVVPAPRCSASRPAPTWWRRPAHRAQSSLTRHRGSVGNAHRGRRRSACPVRRPPGRGRVALATPAIGPSLVEPHETWSPCSRS